MALLWTCKTCHAFKSTELKKWMVHQRKFHSFQPNFKIRCPVDGCHSSYTIYHSLYKHVDKHHRELYRSNERSNHNDDTTINSDIEIETSSNENETSTERYLCDDDNEGSFK